ncbi:hypothetical protein [Micromonospora sp. WMMD737]|uniref:hypothetical protein n=1 Tax=Micromonospora sp. WMMD737 TaxID=3404113 RepID=UPI003B958732
MKLPTGLGVLDVVVLPRTAAPGVDYHRATERQTVTGCGRDLVELTPVGAYLAVGLGCLPCADCWPTPSTPTPPSTPRLRAPAPWPINTTGYRSHFGHGDRAPRLRPATPAEMQVRS